MTKIHQTRVPSFLACILFLASTSQLLPAQESEKQPQVDPGSTRGIIDFERPESAIQLIGEKESRLIPESNYRCQWTFAEGVLTASPKWDSVVTPDAYQDFRMHVEFNVNDAGEVPRERDGNSGVYIQQRYELQILNSFGVTEADYRKDDCGCIYGLKKPDQLVSKPAGEWQSFDIAFRAARFDGSKRTSKARITVYQNGKLIHDDVKLDRKTGAGKREENSARPIKLQGHHNQVRFRNFWIQELAIGEPQDTKPSIPKITTSKKTLPLKGESFKIDGHDAFVILPKNRRGKEIPWVWYAPTLNGLPAKSEVWMFERFLAAGIAIAGIDVGESYGSPRGRAAYHRFYKYLVESRQLGKKPCLLARSRGGLMLYSWAADHPECVSGIAGIYPVCNIASYPGIKKASGAYDLSAEELTAELDKHNPIDRLQGLANSKVPIFHIHGDQDRVVPLEKNSAIIAERYLKLGGKMTLEIVKGQGHNMWTGWFQSSNLVEFVLACHGKTLRTHPVPKDQLWLTFEGRKGLPGNGKHVVLIAAEQEYRSEQSMPMLAAVLAEHHGFDCTVLFSVNEKGEVDPTIPAPLKKEGQQKYHRIPGLEHLSKADCLIWISRFMKLPDDQLKHFHDYFDSGKPIIALRTANHGLWRGTKYMKQGKQVSLRELLGGAFMGHHGGWHREATSGIISDEFKTHPILNGVKKIWGPSDVYRCHKEDSNLPEGCKVLILGQPMMDLSRDAEPNTKKEALPIAWTKSWVGNQNKKSRIFHFTMGSARDFENEGVRRLVTNSVYWGLKLEKEIDGKRSVEPIGDYQPLKSGFNYEKLGVKPNPPAFYAPKLKNK